jgi:hypothetical protein
MPFLDHDGKLAFTTGWFTDPSQPVLTRTVHVSKASVDDWSHLLDVMDCQIEWSGNHGLIHLIGQRPVRVDTTDWERVTEETPVKKPRRGKRQGQAYDWEWEWGRWVRVWL